MSSSVPVGDNAKENEELKPLHNSMEVLDGETEDYDLQIVKQWPKVLARVRYEIYRNRKCSVFNSRKQGPTRRVVNSTPASMVPAQLSSVKSADPLSRIPSRQTRLSTFQPPSSAPAKYLSCAGSADEEDLGLPAGAIIGRRAAAAFQCRRKSPLSRIVKVVLMPVWSR